MVIMHTPHNPPDNAHDGQRPCARGDRCATATVVRDADGSWRREPAPGPRPFCDTDRGTIVRCLDWLPERYLELALRLGDRRTGDGPKVTGGSAASVPVRLDVDALMTDIVSVVASWDERVRHLARLSGPDTQTSRRRRDMIALTGMCRTLAKHVDALVLLPAEPMVRYEPYEKVRAEIIERRGADPHAVLGEDFVGVVRPDAGYVERLKDLSGADAGLEILALDHRARTLLGWTPQHQSLSVPCWECGLRTIVRKDGDAGLEDRAACTNCGTPYEEERYSLLMSEVAQAQAAKARKTAS